MAVPFAPVNASHAGIPGPGPRPQVSRDGRNVGILFAPFRTVAAALNALAFAAPAR